MNSKAKLSTLSLAAIVALAACGKYEKEPVSDIQQLRANAKTRQTMAPPAPQVVEKIREVPKIVIKEVPVEVIKEVPKYIEQTKLDGSVFLISADSGLRFVEGKKLSFKLTARSTFPKSKAKLASVNLPEGASLTADAKDPETFVLSWEPKIGTVPATEALKIFTITVTATVASAENAKDLELLKPLANSKTIDLVVLHDQTPPSELKVEGLASEVDAETAIPFSVTAKVPGVTPATGAEPRLDVTYDGIALSSGNGFQEMNGAYHVVADPARKSTEYVGDGVWKFNRLYNTKGGTVQPQLARDGSVLANADGTRVRLSFKVYSPFGSSTRDALKQLKIRKAKTAEAAPAAKEEPKKEGEQK